MTKKNTSRKRNVRLEFYVDIEEEKIIKRKASKFESLSDYLRQVALKNKIYLPVPAIDRETLIELVRIGNNINQLAKRINQAEANIFQKSTKRELSEALEVLRLVLEQKIEIQDKRVYDSQS